MNLLVAAGGMAWLVLKMDRVLDISISVDKTTCSSSEPCLVLLFLERMCFIFLTNHVFAFSLRLIMGVLVVLVGAGTEMVGDESYVCMCMMHLRNPIRIIIIVQLFGDYLLAASYD